MRDRCTYWDGHVGLCRPLLPRHKQVLYLHLFLQFCQHKYKDIHYTVQCRLWRKKMTSILLLLIVVAVSTSPLCCFDLQELAAMPGHHIPLHKGSDGTDVPQSLVKWQQLRGEVEWSKTSDRATQPSLLFTGQRRNCATQQCIRFHGGTEEWVGVLEKTQENDKWEYQSLQNNIQTVKDFELLEHQKYSLS